MDVHMLQFPQVPPSGNLKKLACRGHIPLTPFALQNPETTSAAFLDFYA